MRWWSLIAAAVCPMVMVATLIAAFSGLPSPTPTVRVTVVFVMGCGALAAVTLGIMALTKRFSAVALIAVLLGLLELPLVYAMISMSRELGDL